MDIKLKSSKPLKIIIKGAKHNTATKSILCFRERGSKQFPSFFVNFLMRKGRVATIATIATRATILKINAKVFMGSILKKKSS